MADTFIIHDGNEERVIGGALLVDPNEPVQCRTFGADGTDTKIIPKDQWKPVTLESWLGPVKNQKQTNSCCPHAATTALETAQNMSGIEIPNELSPGDLYRRINGGSDNGAMPEDALKKLRDEGVATTKTCPPLEFRREMPGAAAERPFNRIDEYLHCDGELATGSALQAGFIVFGGLWWGDGYTPDAEGWLPDTIPPTPVPRRGWGGHAIVLFGWVPDRNGGYRLRNSWDKVFGIQGNCIVHPRAVERGSKDFRWFAIRSTIIASGTLPEPKFAA